MNDYIYQQIVDYNQDWRPTDQRPDAETLAHLVRQLGTRSTAHPHAPGDGWHYLPGTQTLAVNPRGQWFLHPPSSEGAVLAHADDICRQLGLDLAALYNEAYREHDGDRFEPLVITDADRQACARPATLDDIPVVLGDLTSINNHSLAALLEMRWQIALDERSNTLSSETSPVVTAALALDEHALHYTVQLDPDEALAFATRVGEHNGYTPERAAKLLADIAVLLERRDGQPAHYHYLMGREYSRVIYLQLHQLELLNPSGRPTRRAATLVKKLDALAEAAKADEHDRVQQSPVWFTYRLWWN